MFSLCNPTFAREPAQANYDPVLPEGEPYLPGLNQQSQMTADRFHSRRSLLQQIDAEFERVDRRKRYCGSTACGESV
ncbi:MAG: hypothetical protein U0992_16450 [Planctomycetaceae bacterium]